LEDKHYLNNFKIENWDWWFVGRRKIICNTLSRLGLGAGKKILEVGCGTGGNIAMLKNFGDVVAVESNEQAIEYANRKTNCRIYQGYLPNKMPDNLGKFDLICLFDVLEHIEDDAGSINYLYDQLLPGGKIVITVPAYQFLYGPHDISLHHKRRYSRYKLLNLMDGKGFQTLKFSYFNSLLFPAIMLVRLFERAIGRQIKISENREFDNSLLNSFFLRIIFYEAFLMEKIALPFGLSCIAVFRKPIEHI